MGGRVGERHEDAAIGDVEVDVTCRQPLTGHTGPGTLTANDTARLARAQGERARHRQARDLQAPAAAVARVIEPLPRIARDRRLRIPRALAPGETHLARRHERSEEHTSELQSPCNLVCRLLLEK